MATTFRDNTSDGSHPEVDFLTNDNSWWSVRLILKGETLVIKYLGFTDESNGRYNAKDFKDLSEVDKFEERFRRSPEQLQDDECDLMTEGKTVCVCFPFAEDHISFHDAIVETVYSVSHVITKCTCKYLLLWKQGPLVGKKTMAGIESICLIAHGSREEVDTTLTRFLKICRGRFEVDLKDEEAEHDYDVPCKVIYPDDSP